MSLNRRALALDADIECGVRAFIAGEARGLGRVLIDALLPRLQELTLLISERESRAELAVSAKYPECHFEQIVDEGWDPTNLQRYLTAWKGSGKHTRPIDLLVLNCPDDAPELFVENHQPDGTRKVADGPGPYLRAVHELVPCLVAGGNRRVVIVGTGHSEDWEAPTDNGGQDSGLRAIAAKLRSDLTREQIAVTFMALAEPPTGWPGNDYPREDWLVHNPNIARLMAAYLELGEEVTVDEVVFRLTQ